MDRDPPEGRAGRAILSAANILELGPGPLVGTPRDLVRGAQEYFDAGVEVLILGSVSADPRHLDMLCEHVLPNIGRG